MADGVKQALKNLLLHNWSLKVLATIVALLTFYGIRGVTSDKVVYSLPLKVMAENWVTMHDSVKSVEVTFRGSSVDLDKLDPEQTEVVVDTKPNSEGAPRRVAISPGNVNHKAGPGVRAVSVSPEWVHVSFDRKVKKIVPIAPPPVVGQPGVGKVEIDYNPREVTLIGPKQRLANIKIVETEAVNVEGCKTSFSKPIVVSCPIESDLCEMTPTEVNVTVNIITESATRNMPGMKVYAIMEQDIPNDVVCLPDTVNVSLHGSEKSLEGITPGMVKVFVDCTGLDTSKIHKVTVEVHLQDILNVTAAVEPSQVEVGFGANVKFSDSEKKKEDEKDEAVLEDMLTE